VSLTVARSRLPSLLKQLTKTQGTVGISVHGELKGYLVAPKALEPLKGRRPHHTALLGSLTLVGDLEEGSRRVREELKSSLSRLTDQLR
jgi:hypothetical protein